MSGMKGKEFLERICEASSTIRSPVEASDEDIYFASQDGFIYKYKEGKIKQLFEVGGEPSGLAIECTSNVCYIADTAQQGILAKGLDDKSAEFTHIVGDFEGQPLEGPNSLILDNDGRILYFTDSGHFGETNLSNPTGSVFTVDLEDGSISPLCYRSLAYPSGLALSKNQQSLYVAETFANRIIRFYLGEENTLYSVFFQFSGRVGPTALAMNDQDLLFVARYERMSTSLDGQISVLNSAGNLLHNIAIPDYPEINGLSFSKVNLFLYFITLIILYLR